MKSLWTPRMNHNAEHHSCLEIIEYSEILVNRSSKRVSSPKRKMILYLKLIFVLNISQCEHKENLLYTSIFISFNATLNICFWKWRWCCNWHWFTLIHWTSTGRQPAASQNLFPVWFSHTLNCWLSANKGAAVAILPESYHDLWVSPPAAVLGEVMLDWGLAHYTQTVQFHKCSMESRTLMWPIWKTNKKFMCIRTPHTYISYTVFWG